MIMSRTQDLISSMSLKSGEETVDGGEDELRHPNGALPSDLFGYLLSFLPLASIATSSAISREWRTTVNSSLLLHREIDFLHLGSEAQMEDIIQNFNRISSLSLNRLLRVSFNLSSFIKKLKVKKRRGFQLSSFDPLAEPEPEEGTLGFSRLLHLLLNSEMTLLEVSLEIEEETINSALPLLMPLIESLQSFSSLKMVKIKAALLVNLKAGSDSRRFELVGNIQKTSEYSDPYPLVRLMHKVEAFVGTGFTEFGLPSLSSSGTVLFDNYQVFYRLFDSTSCLKFLDLSALSDVNGRELWDFSTECLNLESVSLYLTRNESMEDGSIPLKYPPERALTNGLKNLALTVSSYRGPSNEFSEWVGNHMETLEIRKVHDHMIISGLGFYRIVSNSRNTLQVIHLVDCSIQPEVLNGDGVFNSKMWEDWYERGIRLSLSDEIESNLSL